MRGCTDVPCVVVFLVALGGLGWILEYARKNGDIKKIVNGYDYQGRLCGVDVPEPLLYYCQDSYNMGTLDFARPICVSSCPVDTASSFFCASGQTSGYATKDVAGRYCAPTSSAMVQQMASAMAGGDRLSDVSSKVAELPEVWLALLVSVVVSLVIGYVFLHGLDWCAGPMVCLSLGLLVAVPTCVGAYIVWTVKFSGGVEGVPDIMIGNEEQTFYAGCGLLGLGAILSVMMLCALGSMEMAIGCIKTATDCMSAMPSMLLVPLFEVLSKVIVMTAMLAGFALLVSCGDVTSAGGMYKSFSFTTEQYGYLAFYIFMMLWVCELFTSVSQFVVAHAAQAWYFTPYKNGSKSGAPSCSILTGYLLAGSAHLGSLLLGAFLIATLRFVRMCLEWVRKRSKESGNSVLACLASVVGCCVWCFQKFIEFINKTAYIEIAIEGTSFCTAAKDAIAVMVKQVGAVSILHGATFVLQLGCVGAVAFGGGFATKIMVEYVPPFNDVTSQHYVSDPMFVAGVSAIIGAIIGVAFMVVFDTVSDTMLFCFAKDTEKAAKEASTSSASTAGRPSPCGAFLSCGASKKETGPLKSSEAQKPDHTPEALKSLLAEHRSGGL